VLAVHFPFGFAPHIGQRTESICFNVSFSDFTTIVLNMVGLERWSILLGGVRLVPKGESTGGETILWVPEKPPE